MRYWTVNFSRHATIFQIHGASKGLGGWAGPGVRWGGRGGMVSTSLLLINTGKSSQKHIIISFRRRRIGGVEEKKERKHLKQARLYVLCIAALQNTKINKSQGFVKWMWCFNSFGLAGEATTSSEGTKVNWIKFKKKSWTCDRKNLRSVDYKDSFLIVLAVAATFGLVYLVLFFAVRKDVFNE